MSFNNQELSPVNQDIVCETDILTSKCSFVWKIKKFDSRKEKNGEELVSKSFSIQGPSNETTKWQVRVYPQGESAESKDHISIYLEKISGEDAVLLCVLSSLNIYKTKQQIVKFEKLVKYGVSDKKSWGWTKCIPRTSICHYTPDGTLTLIFDITVFGETAESIEYVEKKKEKKKLVLFPNYHHEKLTRDFESILNSRDYSDITVTCENKEFKCHKIILTSRCQVFKTMLESNMKEKETGSIEIKDMKLDIFEDLLKYIYSGEAPNIDEHAGELFAAADLYQLEHLKELCEVKLCAGIDITNCINLLVLGELHNASTLKAFALNFVSKNIQNIESSEWRMSLIAYPTLFADVVEMMFSKNNSEDEKKRTAFS